MNRVYLLFILLLVSTKVFGQGAPLPPPPSIWITSPTSGSQILGCESPDSALVGCQGGVSALDSTGLVLVDISFGDGQDTTVSAEILIDQQIQFSASVFHAYQNPGSYQVQMQAWQPATSSPGYSFESTSFQYVILDTCGNVDGCVYLDDNSNCVKDSGELGLANSLVNIYANGQYVGSDYTSSVGTYHFNVPPGLDYTVHLNTGGFTNVCLASGISIPNVPSSDNDLGVVCNTQEFDLEGAITGWGFRPGMTGILAPHVWNNGCLPKEGTLKVLLDPITTFQGSVPDSVVTWSGDTAIFDFEALAAYSWVNQGLMMQIMVDSSAILATEVCFDMWICPEDGDSDVSNNYIHECFPVVNSYDPNDKQVTPAGVGDNGAILPDQTMTYKLRFQNTGTAEAFNVFIMDTIDADLDMSTFQVLSASHHMEVFFPDERVIKFNFPNINLPDSTTNEPESHGYVLYRISQNPGLVPGTSIENTGHIYFDINPPVVTNTTVNTIDLFVDVEPMVKNGEVEFYPNPSNGSIIVMTEFSGSVLTILDMTGRDVLNETLTIGVNSIDISRFNNGSYILRVESDGRVSTSRLIKMEK